MKPGTVAQPEGDLRSVEGWKPHDFITECSLGGHSDGVRDIYVCCCYLQWDAPKYSSLMAGLGSRGRNNATENADFHRYLTPIEQRSLACTARGEQVDCVHSDNT